jgi:DNA-binding protein HU-beta
MVIQKNNRDNLKKEDISKNIFLITGVPKLYLSKIINDILNILISNLNLRRNLKIKNFGTFKVLKKKSRIGRNPKNNKTYTISSRLVATFKASNKLNLKIRKNVKK